jgi:putative nucleotidyltransferase with HDIG domain
VSEPIRFLTSFVKAISTMGLYGPAHPARTRAVSDAYAELRELQKNASHTEFSFLGEEVVFGQVPLREMRDWDWAARLAEAGVQRLEFAADVTRDDFEEFLEGVVIRLDMIALEAADQRPAGAPTTIRFGALGVRGSASLGPAPVSASLPVGRRYELKEEVATVEWMHREVGERGHLPLLEAESVVRSLAVAMHGDQEMLLPLLSLREFDEYTTTHSLNVSVLTMALAEEMGHGPRDVRAFGVAALLHDLGKTRVPLEVLNKPGRLSDAEREIMQRHPADGARLILASDRQLDLAAAVAYEHHIMIDGGGYPRRRQSRACHCASTLVHVCDVYDALRTRRPYREAWEQERVLQYIQDGAGTDFDPDTATRFVALLRRLDGRIDLTTLRELRDAEPADAAPAPEAKGAA